MADTDQDTVYDSSPLSKWVRPLLGLLGGIIGMLLAVFLAIQAVQAGQWPIALLLVGLVIAFGGYFFGVRSQDKFLNALLTTQAANTNTLMTLKAPVAQPVCPPQATYTAASGPTQNYEASTSDNIVNDIVDGIEADGIPVTDQAIASRIISWIGAHGSELMKPDLADLLDTGIILAKRAFGKNMMTKDIPETYADCADYNAWWRDHSPNCQVKDFGIAKPLLMTLRDLLKQREELNG
jgi:hypothetical protein